MTYRFQQDWAHSDPAPNVPTLEEIQLAEQLRRRLELRLLPRTDVRARKSDADEYDWAARCEVQATLRRRAR